MPRLVVLAALAASLVGAASAQPLSTDRPDFTESPFAVAPGRIQVELGATLESLGRRGDSPFADQTQVMLPEALVRVGVLPGVELRAMAPDYSRSTLSGADFSVDGFTDPSVGLKVEVGNFGGFAVGVLAQASLPLGEEEFSDERVVPSVIVTGGGDLTPTISFGAQIGTELYGENNGPFSGRATVGGTFVASVAIDERTGVFAELALEDVIGGVVDPSALVHTGATLLLSPNAQLDAHAGIGLASYAPDYLVGVGASVRL